MGGKGGGFGVKNFFPHPNELLIWAYAENLAKIGHVVEALDELCGMALDIKGRHRMAGQGTGCNSIDNLSPSFWL